MQIRNDFSNFSGREYHNSHTHHITKCLHEEEHKKHDGGDFGIRKETVQQDKGTEHKTQQDVFFEYNAGTGRQKTPMKKGLGMLKGIWDSMGQEEPERIKEAPAAGQKGLLHSHIAEAASAFQAAVSDRIAGRWGSVKEKIKVHIKSAFKHFGRNRDFGTLSDPKGRSTGNREGTKWHHYGWFGMAGNYLLMMFYTMVAGWMMYYCFRCAKGDFSSPSMDAQVVVNRFNEMLSSPEILTLWMFLTVLLAFGVCSFGVQKGVERITKIMMTALLALIVILAVHSVRLPGAIEGVKFLLNT